MPGSVKDERQGDQLLDKAAASVRSEVRAILQSEVVPRALQIDDLESLAFESYQALAATHGGLWADADDGGSGHSTLSYAVAVEEIAAVCPSTSTIFMTQMHAGYPIQLEGSKEQRSRFIPRLCRGEIYGSIAITEPEAGSDAGSMKTTARRDGDSYVLDGSKTFITTGNEAGVIVLFATIDRDAGPSGITAFCIEPPVAGFSAGRSFEKLGMRGSPTAELFFDECRVPASCRLGEEGGGWSLSLKAVRKTRISAAAQGVGVAMGAYRTAIAWALDKGLLEGSAAKFQEVKFALADMRARILSARLLLYVTANLVDGAGEDDITSSVSMAKLLCTDTAMSVALDAMDLLGSDGDRPELDVERFVRDAKVLQIYDGTNQIQRFLISRDFLEEE